MTAGPAPVPSPAHPLPALATFELRDYRHALERALAALPGDAAARGPLQDRLAAVLAEQDSRAALAAARPVPGMVPPALPARLFRALFAQFELRTIGGVHIAVPAGTRWYAGTSLGEIARQISAASPGPVPRTGGQAGSGD